MALVRARLTAGHPSSSCPCPRRPRNIPKGASVWSLAWFSKGQRVQAPLWASSSAHRADVPLVTTTTCAATYDRCRTFGCICRHRLVPAGEPMERSKGGSGRRRVARRRPNTARRCQRCRPRHRTTARPPADGSTVGSPTYANKKPWPRSWDCQTAHAAVDSDRHNRRDRGRRVRCVETAQRIRL